jgi:hypothetical protein
MDSVWIVYKKAESNIFIKNCDLDGTEFEPYN